MAGVCQSLAFTVAAAFCSFDMHGLRRAAYCRYMFNGIGLRFCPGSACGISCNATLLMRVKASALRCAVGATSAVPN